MRVAVAVAALVWLAVLGAACRADRSSTLSSAAHALAPYREQFVRFDTWARRAQATARVTPNRAAFDEATFAPIRNASSILAAWVEPPQAAPLAMPASTALPTPVDWVSLRDDELGVIRVASAQPCPVELPAWWRHGRAAGRCVLASRGGAASHDQELVVTVAFLPEE